MRLSTLSLAAAGLASLAIISPPAAAAIITQELAGIVTLGPFAGTEYAGRFNYEGSAITGIGNERVTPLQSLTLEFTIFGQTFRETDDQDYDFFPELRFTDGFPVSLDFFVNETPPAPLNPADPPLNSTDIVDSRVFNFHLGSLQAPTRTGFEVEVSINIPEPAGAAFAAASGLGLGLFALKRCRGKRAAG